MTFDDMVGKPYVAAFQNFLQIENQLNIKKVMSKNVMNPYSIFFRGRGHFIQSTLSTLSIWITLLCIQCCIIATNTIFDSFDLSKMSNN